MGRWTHVDRELDIQGVATIVSLTYPVPDDVDAIQSGCPANGYWEYSLKFSRKSNHRPKYGIAESFLFRIGSRGHKMVNRFYVTERKKDSVYKELEFLRNELTSTQDSLAHTKTIKGYKNV
jgi:hypothetical protein